MRAPRVRAAVSSFGLVFAVAIAGGVRARAADDYSNRLGVTFGGGPYKLVGGALDHTTMGPMAQLGLRLGWRRHWDLETTARSGFTWDDTKTRRNRATSFELDALYNRRPEARWTPQAFAGAGVLFWNVVDFDGVPSPGPLAGGPTARGFKADGNPEVLSDANYTLFGGLAAQVALTRRVSLRAGVRLDFLVSQQTDNSGASDTSGTGAATPTQRRRAADAARLRVDANNWVPAGFIGITYFFGERDADRDGVANAVDAAPYDSEDMDGFQDEDGVPDLDNDADGIADVADKCPNEVEDMDGFEDEDGCPDLDNDADGITDAADKCPNEAEDKDGFEDEDGCPDLDNDADGVPDAKDGCAETPTGVPVDTLGCPTAARLDSTRVLGGIRFKARTAELLPQSQPALDSLVQSLGAWPKAEIEIQAHTSAEGPAERNLNLSQARADAVLRWLVEHGVAPQRLVAAGYGAQQPVAANDDPATRGRNERLAVKPMDKLPPLEPKEEIKLEEPKKSEGEAKPDKPESRL